MVIVTQIVNTKLLLFLTWLSGSSVSAMHLWHLLDSLVTKMQHTGIIMYVQNSFFRPLGTDADLFSSLFMYLALKSEHFWWQCGLGEAAQSLHVAFLSK